MSDTVQVRIDSEGSIEFEVDREEYEAAREAGDLDSLFDVWASDMDDRLFVTVDGKDLTREVYGG